MGIGPIIATQALGAAIDVVLGVISSSTLKIERASSGEMEQLELEAARQSVRLKMAKIQAQIAQEVAIANRIESAEEVEIEEFYDAAGKGRIGADVGKESLTIGLGVEGRVITKRVYHFKGWRVVADLTEEDPRLTQD